MFGVRTDRYKLIRYYEPQWDMWEMFDLEKDPEEMNNVAEDAAYQEIRKDLEQRLIKLRKQYNDDTGTVGGGEFPITAGITRVEREGKSYRIWANAPGGYLLKTGNRVGNVALSSQVLPLAGKQNQNAYVVFSGGQPRGQMMRIGYEVASKRLVIMGPQWRKITAKTPLEWDGKTPIDLQIHVDFDQHEVTAEAGGKKITAKMPTDWTSLRSWGYGANNAEAVFTPLDIRRVE
jgi:hypothetical protein